jgi:hypothetical protein
MILATPFFLDCVRLALESDRAEHLLLLDEGPEEIIYCLCPSHFAPDTRLQPGCNLLPQRGARYDSLDEWVAALAAFDLLSACRVAPQWAEPNLRAVL